MFPALLLHWEQDFAWSKTELALAFSSALIVSALTAPLAGRLIDLDHGRKVLAGGALSGGLLILLLTQVNFFWQFYLVWLALGVVMACSLYEACFAYLTHLLGIEAKKAITLVTLVAGFAGTVSFPTAHFLTEAFGWRGSIVVFSFLICCIAAPLIWFSAQPQLDSEEIQARSKADSRNALRQALRSPVFWLLAIAFSMLALDHGILITHLLPLLAERNISVDAAVLAASMIGPMQVFGRLVMIAAERYVSIVIVCAASFVCLMIASIALFGAVAIPLLIVPFVVLQGSGNGVTSITRPVITAQYLGRSGFGAISGVQASFFMGASAIAPTFAALIWELGGYDLVLGVCIGLTGFGLICFLMATRLRMV